MFGGEGGEGERENILAIYLLGMFGSKHGLEVRSLKSKKIAFVCNKMLASFLNQISYLINYSGTGVT
jgi:hypothetical protein